MSFSSRAVLSGIAGVALAAVAALGWPGPAQAARARWLAMARLHPKPPTLAWPDAG